MNSKIAFIETMEDIITKNKDFLLNISDEHNKEFLQKNPEVLNTSLFLLHSIKYNILNTNENINESIITCAFDIPINLNILFNEFLNLLKNKEITIDEIKKEAKNKIEENLKKIVFFTQNREIFFIQKNGIWIENPKKNYLHKIINLYTNLPVINFYNFDFYDEYMNMGY